MEPKGMPDVDKRPPIKIAIDALEQVRITETKIPKSLLKKCLELEGNLTTLHKLREHDAQRKVTTK